jgi:hypothetical protein
MMRSQAARARAGLLAVGLIAAVVGSWWALAGPSGPAADAAAGGAGTPVLLRIIGAAIEPDEMFAMHARAQRELDALCLGHAAGTSAQGPRLGGAFRLGNL